MESGRDFGFEKKVVQNIWKRRDSCGRTAKIEKEDLKSEDLPRAKT